MRRASSLNCYSRSCSQAARKFAIRVGGTGRHEDRNMKKNPIFLSSIFLSICPVPLRLCRAALFASLRLNGPLERNRRSRKNFAPLRTSVFGFRSSDFLRISGFGFRISGSAGLRSVRLLPAPHGRAEGRPPDQSSGPTLHSVGKTPGPPRSGTARGRSVLVAGANKKRSGQGLSRGNGKGPNHTGRYK